MPFIPIKFTITEKCSFDPPDDLRARLGWRLSPRFTDEKSGGPEGLNPCSRPHSGCEAGTPALQGRQGCVPYSGRSRPVGLSLENFAENV